MSTTHEPKACERIVRETFYVGKGWKSRFVCPTCGRATFQALNFLGTRKVVCDGRKFTKPKQ